MKPRALTNAEITAMGEEYRKLLVQAELQTAEQREFLRREIANDVQINLTDVNRLHQELDHFKLLVARVDDNNVLHQIQVQVVYDIPDELYAYLRRSEPQLPRALRGFLDGGIDITGKSKDTRVDTAPQTGKKQ